ncbi:hypothetical protein HPB50_010714 [Hyalomma asiaticum]|uniref:Uncharacterized protein n=1 Tax=Hyalomma asiaticum TaxID=266040 RepID=A0ACB7SDZ3_HYAAI|nr:hypothetical protein HPB50_010714 [Hyalomma asiaticum]
MAGKTTRLPGQHIYRPAIAGKTVEHGSNPPSFRLRAFRVDICDHMILDAITTFDCSERINGTGTHTPLQATPRHPSKKRQKGLRETGTRSWAGDDDDDDRVDAAAFGVLSFGGRRPALWCSLLTEK